MLLDSLSDMSGSLYASANGLDKLNQARDTISNGKDKVYSDADALRGDLAGIAAVLQPVSGQIDAAATWSPNTVTLEQQLGDDYLVLGNNTDYSDRIAFPGSFVCLPEYADKNA